MNYNREFPDLIDGLNFDNYDENAAILYTKSNKQISGTCRLIFDSSKRFPIEEKTSLSNLREDYKKILEVSRLIIKHEQNGLNLDFKNLTKGTYLILSQNEMDLAVSVIKNEHFKLYSKFGGFEIEQEVKGYGELNSDFIITSWKYKEVSNFFKKAFLS